MNIDTQIKNRGDPLFFIGFMREGCVCAKQVLRALGSIRNVSTEEANYVLELV